MTLHGTEPMNNVEKALDRARREVVGQAWSSDPVLAQLVDDQLAVTPWERLDQLAVAAEFFDAAVERH